MSDRAATEVPYEEVLSLTSALRNAVVESQESPSALALREAVLDAGRALHASVGGQRLEPLVPYAEALRRLTRLWASRGGPLDSVVGAVGLIEQALDGFAAGCSAEHMRSLYEDLRQATPPQWQVHLDSDDVTFEAQLDAALHPDAAGASAPEPESPEQAFQRELRATFIAESDEGFAVCEELLVQLEQRADDREVLDALLRKFHTLKGGASAVDLPEAAAQLHSGESLLQAARDATIVLDSVALVDFLLRLTDSIRGLIDRSCGRADTPYAVISDLPRAIAALSGPTSVAAAADSQAGIPHRPTGIPNAAPGVPTTDAHPDPVVLGSQLHALTELRERLGRGEGAGDIRLFIDALDRQARQFLDLASELKEQVNNLVVVPLEQVFRRMQRPARDAARQEGKLVTLELSGGETRVDRAIVERLHGPLLHIVRNAVSHGIESPAAREAAGKHRTGTVRVRAEPGDRNLILIVEDDGSGLDLAAIRAKAEVLGWIDPQQPPSHEALTRLILRSGFSTRDDVTDLAGRGVGMDVVAREVETLHGTIDIESHDGKGTRIRLAIPVDTPAAGSAAPRSDG